MTQNRFTPAGLSVESAAEVTVALQDRLVGLVDLALTLKHIHWNVVGAGFIAVHEMLDEHVAAIRAMSDEVAERIATLGAVPNGLAGHLVSSRTWDDYALGKDVVAAHMGALDKVYDGVISDHRDAIEVAAKHDPITEDLFVAQTRQLELLQWFVRAHIESADGDLLTAGATTENAAARAAVAGLQSA